MKTIEITEELMRKILAENGFTTKYKYKRFMIKNKQEVEFYNNGIYIKEEFPGFKRDIWLEFSDSNFIKILEVTFPDITIFLMKELTK